MFLTVKQNVYVQTKKQLYVQRKRQIPGSISFVPSAAGLIIASVVVQDILGLD